MADIPVVSLAGDEKEMIVKLDTAFRNVGFVFVLNHGILQVRLTINTDLMLVRVYSQSAYCHFYIRRGLPNALYVRSTTYLF